MSCGQNSVLTMTNKRSGANCNTQSSCGTGDCGVAGLSPRRFRGKLFEEVADFVLLMLGVPQIGVELDQQQLDLCISFALKHLEYYCPPEFFRYMTFFTSPGRSVYPLNNPDIAYIRAVNYKQTSEYDFSSELGSLPITFFGSLADSNGFMNPLMPQYSNMGSFSIFSSYNRMFSRLSSQLGSWEYVDSYRAIKLYPIPTRAIPVSIHYLRRCEDFQGEIPLLLQDGALLFSKKILNSIRSKYQNLPFGPGSVTLEKYEGIDQEIKDWRDRIQSEWAEMPGITFA